MAKILMQTASVGLSYSCCCLAYTTEMEMVLRAMPHRPWCPVVTLRITGGHSWIVSNRPIRWTNRKRRWSICIHMTSYIKQSIIDRRNNRVAHDQELHASGISSAWEELKMFDNRSRNGSAVNTSEVYRSEKPLIHLVFTTLTEQFLHAVNQAPV